MNFYADSNYIHARICALHSLLLARKDYYNIAESGHFQNFMPDLNSFNIKNDYIEIKERIFNTQIKMIISLAEASVSCSSIFILFLRYFETQNLKLIFAKAFSKKPSSAIWYDIGDFATLDRGMIADNTDVASVLKYTRNTWMKDILTVESAGSFDTVEFLIDRASLRIAAEFPYSINFSHRTDTLKIVSGLAACFHLSWSWRLQQIYSWDSGSIKSYIESNIVLPESVRTLQPSIDEWKLILMKQILGNHAVAMAPWETGITAAEKIMERVLLRDFSRIFNENFHTVNTVSCYLALLYRQIRNLFAIVDGLRYSLSPDIIMENIICEE